MTSFSNSCPFVLFFSSELPSCNCFLVADAIDGTHGSPDDDEGANVKNSFAFTGKKSADVAPSFTMASRLRALVSLSVLVHGCLERCNIHHLFRH